MSQASLLNLYRRVKSATVGAAQNVTMLTPSGFHKKRSFSKYLKFLRETQWMSSEWHAEYQVKQLRALIDFASKQVPFYVELFGKNSAVSGQIRNLDDLRKLPLVSKSILENNLQRFLPEHTRHDLVSYSPGWNPDAVCDFPVEREAAIMEEALLARHWENCGYQPGRPLVYLSNRSIEGEHESYTYDGVHNRHCFNVSLLTPKNLSEYCQKIKATDAGFVFGYPGALEIFADSIIQWGIELDFLGVMSAWEVLTDTARKKIETAFGAKVYDWYGLSFPAASMGQCHYCEGYHSFSEYGILELVDFDGNPVTKKGEVGRMVATSLTNRAMPLIRYDTGDLGIYNGEQCRCGRGLPKIVERIPGRTRDLLISDDGRYLLPDDFYELFSELGIPAAKFRIIQGDRRSFSVRLARDLECHDEVPGYLKKALSEKIGGNPEIIVEIVDRIGTENGKIRPVMRNFDPIKEGVPHPV